MKDYDCEICEEIKELIKLGFENQKNKLKELLREFDDCLENFDDLWQKHMYGGD